MLTRHHCEPHGITPYLHMAVVWTTHKAKGSYELDLEVNDIPLIYYAARGTSVLLGIEQILSPTRGEDAAVGISFNFLFMNFGSYVLIYMEQDHILWRKYLNIFLVDKCFFGAKVTDNSVY